MENNFTVEIISPEKSIIKTSTNEVILPSFEGEMGILKDHIPLITFLRPGLIYIKNENERKYFVEEGTVEFSNNNLLILTSTAKELPNIDQRTLDEIISDAKKKIGSDEVSDKEKYLLSHKIDTLKNINQ
tara:strand:- start:258 stop:647 length:390 start_codon:yes stop_codon:yes gene_type:complete